MSQLQRNALFSQLNLSVRQFLSSFFSAFLFEFCRGFSCGCQCTERERERERVFGGGVSGATISDLFLQKWRRAHWAWLVHIPLWGEGVKRVKGILKSIGAPWFMDLVESRGGPLPFLNFYHQLAFWSDKTFIFDFSSLNPCHCDQDGLLKVHL